MDGLAFILSRKSVRKFTPEPIPEEALHRILTAGMAGPSCADTRDWSFVIVRDKTMLGKMADANGPYAAPLRGAAVGILVCGDKNRAFPPAKDYWVVDGSIAAQNILLAAEALGYGGVWLGTWPQQERVQAEAELFHLPEGIVPHSVLALGCPASPAEHAPRDFYEADRVHFEMW